MYFSNQHLHYDFIQRIGHYSTTKLLSTLTQMTGLIAHKSAGRTLLVTLDHEKGNWHSTLHHNQTKKIFRHYMCTHFKNGLVNCLTGRHGFVEHNGTNSTTKKITNGVPQGYVLHNVHPSPSDLLVHDTSYPYRTDTDPISYVDDIPSSHHPPNLTQLRCTCKNA